MSLNYAFPSAYYFPSYLLKILILKKSPFRKETLTFLTKLTLIIYVQILLILLSSKSRNFHDRSITNSSMGQIIYYLFHYFERLKGPKITA